MNLLVSLGISIGVLAGLWTAATMLVTVITLSTPAGFIAWATYFASGGGIDGLKKALGSNISGVLWGAVIILVNNALSGVVGSVAALSLGVFVGAFGMCVQAKFDILAFIPGAFVGCATYFFLGANLGTSIITAIIGLVCGAILGFISDKFAAVLRGEKAEAK